MNFYFEAAKILDKLEKKQGSIKGVLSDVAEKDRKRTSALVIESLKCTFALVVGWSVMLSRVMSDSPNPRQTCVEGRDIQLKVTQGGKEAPV
jgi:hypothetical protein